MKSSYQTTSRSFAVSSVSSAVGRRCAGAKTQETSPRLANGTGARQREQIA